MRIVYLIVFILAPALLKAVLQSGEERCGFTRQWLESLTVSRELRKNGFHRELVTSVCCGLGSPKNLHFLLVERLPKGIYIDPYQLTSEQHDTGLQVLLDTEIDVEAPAYISSAFSALVYPTRDPASPVCLKAVVPIHGRYHRPSDSGKRTAPIDIENPRLLLRADSCDLPPNFIPYTLTDAPCTALNHSMCRWLQIHSAQEPGPLRLEIPVGDMRLVGFVSAATLLVTLLSCGYLAGAVWRNEFLQSCPPVRQGT
ncbi:PIGX protein, partial [Atractosteus spatula]|nr:PIGX protein [Atractosteus spatula]